MQKLPSLSQKAMIIVTRPEFKLKAIWQQKQAFLIPSLTVSYPASILNETDGPEQCRRLAIPLDFIGNIFYVRSSLP